MHEIVSLSNYSQLVGKEKSTVSLWLISVDMHRVLKERKYQNCVSKACNESCYIRPDIMANAQVKVQSRYDSFSLDTVTAIKLHTFSPTMDLMRQVITKTGADRILPQLHHFPATGSAQCHLHNVLVSSHVPSQITRKTTEGVKITLGVQGGDILVDTVRMDFFWFFPSVTLNGIFLETQQKSA